MTKKTFAEIVDSVDTSYLGQLMEDSSVQDDDVHLNIAVFARWISKAHVGWNHFDESVRTNFEKAVETLYNNVTGEESKKELAQKLTVILCTTIPDCHCRIRCSEQFLTDEEYDAIPNKLVNPLSPVSVGDNVALYDKEQLNAAGIEILKSQINQGNKKPMMILQKGKTGIVAFSTCAWPITSEIRARQDELIATFKNNLHNWDSVIIDVRGNRGGDSITLTRIARILYGGSVPYCDTTWMRNSPEARFLHAGLDDFINEKDKKYFFSFLNNFYEQNPIGEVADILMWDFRDLHLKCPYQPEHEVEVRILSDRHTGSSGEGILNELSNHPHCKRVGENSCGMNQYGQIRTAPLPNGLSIAMGIEFRTFENGNIEGIGYPPHISTVGNDAFSVALEELEVLRIKHLKHENSNHTTLPVLQHAQVLENKIKEQKPLSTALAYALMIADNLPEWNHSQAHLDVKTAQKIARQKLFFLSQANRINANLPSNIQLQTLGAFIATHIPDNHIDIKDSTGKSVISRQRPTYSKTAFNLACQSVQDLKQQGFSSIQQISVQSEKTPWLIATKWKTGIIAIPSFDVEDSKETASLERKFIDKFFKEKETHKWDNLIFDLRGNTGGDCAVIKEIAERISEMELRYSDTCEVIHPRVKTKEQRNVFKQKKHDTQEHYQTNHSDAFKGNIFVLQDGWCASATEGAIYMLSQIPNTKTIGETTSGTFAGGCCVTVPMEVGSLIIGTEYRTRHQKERPVYEKEGLLSDIGCPSSLAFDYALKEINNPRNCLNTFLKTKKNDSGERG